MKQQRNELKTDVCECRSDGSQWPAKQQNTRRSIACCACLCPSFHRYL